MAGISAGTLNIEIVAEIAKLQDDMRKVQQSVGGMADGVGRSTKYANDNLAAVTKTSGQARAGMQQLGYQLGDVATMFSMGAKPAQIFASQIGQVTQAVQMMSGGTSRLAAFLGGPWGIALSVGVIAMAPFIDKLWAMVSGAEAATGALEDLIRKRAQAFAQQNQLPNAEKDLDALVARRDALLADIEKRGVRNANGQLMFVYKQQQEVAALNKQIGEGRAAIDAERNSRYDLNKVMDFGTTVTEKTTTATRGHTSARREAKKATEELTQAEKDLAALRALSAEARDVALGKLPEAKMLDIMDDLADKYNGAKEVAAAYGEMARNEFERVNDELIRTISLFEQLGGMGNVLGAAIGILTGNTASVGGKLGALLNIGIGTKLELDSAGKSTGRIIAKTLGDELSQVFSQTGAFGKTMIALFQGAGQGMMAGSIVGNSKGNKIGGALGGAFGTAFGAPFGPVGSAVGSIVGGVLGSAIGGIFKTTKNGYAVINNNGVTSGGSSGDLAASSKNTGLGIQSALSNMAGQFGTTVGDYSVSIGKRSSGWFHVDGNGAANVGNKGWEKTSGSVVYRGKDEAEAVRLALMNAIADGALQGISAGAKTLLTTGKDLDAQMQKALRFEGVFKDLKASVDPVGLALENLNKEFDDLRKIFTEAGASAADFAQLEQLLVIKRQEAIDRAKQQELDALREPVEMRVRILELLGRQEDALAASRMLELAGVKEALQPLQVMIYQLEDARTIIEQFGPLSDDLRAFKQELFSGNVSNSYAATAARFREVSALAKGGDADALGQLRGASKQFLDAALSNASSRLEYDRAVGEVLNSVEQGIFAADSQIEYAQMQIDAINANADILAGLRQDMKATQERIIAQGEWVERMFRRWDGEGQRVQNDATTPIYVQVVA